jgi:hypothetical protein
MAVMIAGPGSSGANPAPRAAHSNAHHRSRQLHGHPKDANYAVDLHMEWGVHYPELPLHTGVTVTYITTPDGCTNDEKGAKYTLDHYGAFGYDISPLFEAKSTGSCAIYASFADYGIDVKYPDGSSAYQRIRVQEDGTSENYHVVCVGAGTLGCSPGVGTGHKPDVNLRG